ncbi:MAG: exodeoxyribonuclease V subunit gamma, partial [Arenimonas sp.]
TDFRLYHGNDLEVLAGVLAAELARPLAGRSVLTPDTILIPQPAMRRWLQKTLAETHGIAANLRFLAPGEFVREALDANVPGAGDASVGDAATLRWRLWRVLSDAAAMREPVFAPLHAVLAEGGLAAWRLADELAQAFEKYQAWRRDWLRRWDHGGDRDDWQAELWRRATRRLNHRGKRLDAYLSRFDGLAPATPAGLPARVFAFACQNVSPDVLRVIASSARAGTLHFFFLSPVAAWWGDLLTARERLSEDAGAVFADDENPLLRANGAAGRDFVRVLFSADVVQPTFELPLYVAPSPFAGSGLLQRVQGDLLARRPPAHTTLPQALPDFGQVARADRSLQVHACHTRLREVQVLHDQLRQLLESDPLLQARDIAVLTPDIDQYAAHVHAVFGGSKPALQIPYALSDGSALATQPLVDAFLRLLALPDARFTVNEVLELLAVPAIAQRLQLEASDFEILRFWLRQAGARWGIDAAHRHALGAPAEDAYTWAFAMDRLLLGHASGDDSDIEGVAPWPDLEGSALLSLDSLLQGLHKLAQLQRALAGSHSPRQWQVLLGQALDSLFPERPVDDNDRRALELLRAQIAVFSRQTAAAELRDEVPLRVVQDWFAAALAECDARQPFLTGGVTFGRMVPMRLVPFKVICLLGMNDGDFPRRDPIGSLNRLSAELPTARRQLGDRSVREDDRGLFLQLFAAATRVFYLSYLGMDPRSGESAPPSVVVAELLDVVSRYFENAEQARAQFTVLHPLQPFAAEAFGRGDARRISYQVGWRAAAGDTDSGRQAMPAFSANLPADEAREEPLQLSRDTLVRALCNPAREFLSARIGLRLPEHSERLPDAEPFDRQDGLHKYLLAERVFAAAIAGRAEPRARLFRRLLAEGLIAPGAAGQEEVLQLLEMLAPSVSAWLGWGDDAAQAMPYELQLGTSTLTGRLFPTHRSGLRQFSASSDHGKTRLSLGVDALIWSALGQSRPIQRVVIGQLPQCIAPLPEADARAQLLELLDVAAASRRAALPFMPKAGFAYARDPTASSAWSTARQLWSSHRGFGEGEDPWVRLALRGVDPFLDGDAAAVQEFQQLATRVFGNLPAELLSSEHTDE